MTDAFANQPPAPETQYSPEYEQFTPPEEQLEDLQNFPETNQDLPVSQPQQPQFQEYQNQPQQLTETSSTSHQGELVILEWEAPNRPFKKRNRQYYMTVAIIVGLISAILLVAGQFLPIAVVISVAFLAYVLSAVPPETVTHSITTYGIRAEDALFYWEELGRFWFSDKYGQRLLHVEVSRFPFQLTLVIESQLEDELTEILSSVLLYERPIPTSFDKAAKWLQDKIPLDTES